MASRDIQIATHRYPPARHTTQEVHLHKSCTYSSSRSHSSPPQKSPKSPKTHWTVECSTTKSCALCSQSEPAAKRTSPLVLSQNHTQSHTHRRALVHSLPRQLPAIRQPLRRGTTAARSISVPGRVPCRRLRPFARVPCPFLDPQSLTTLSPFIRTCGRDDDASRRPRPQHTLA